ncbi:MAG TPA: hypothetical protein VGQ57_15490 [Polyangiaceae bacterium]|jgi:hypothetical protein|nr:hypothetical protein [Polyangiaceae bacterium]
MAFLLASACGASSFDGHVFRRGELAFRVGPIPASWRPIEVDDTLLAFRDDDAAATVAVNGRCGLDGDDVPLEALTHHLFLHFTDRKLMSQERFELDGRAALRTELSAALDGVPLRYRVVVVKKDGCVYDFMLMDTASGGAGAFDRFVAGFETVR